MGKWTNDLSYRSCQQNRFLPSASYLIAAASHLCVRPLTRNKFDVAFLVEEDSTLAGMKTLNRGRMVLWRHAIDIYIHLKGERDHCQKV